MNRNNSHNNNKYQGHNNKPVYDRLGQKTTDHKGPILKSDTKQQNHQDRQRNFSRKRMSDGEPGPSGPKQRRNNRRRPPYYQTPRNNSRPNFAQKRMEQIRRNSLQENHHIVVRNDLCDAIDNNTANANTSFNDSQEIDATDFTVQVLNPDVPSCDESRPVKFKMILDPKTQAAINSIQSKRKEKQVIFPFPVTPNVTSITLHRRFALL